MTSTLVDFDSVQVEDLSRRFGRRRALSHISIEAHAGEIIALLGPNGSGKSTLLSVLSTMLPASGGRVTYGGRGARELGDGVRGRIGWLGHEVCLYGDLTATENLAFFAELYQLDDLPGVVGDALRRARLDDRAHDRVSSFSRGMRQRLALERALVHRPRLVLLDEPFTGLDEASAGLLEARLITLKAERAIVIMATHDFEYAERVSTRALCLSDGRAQWVGDGMAPLRDRYRQTLQAATA